MHEIQKSFLPLQSFCKKSGCSTVGSALRSGRRGRWFESGHPDNKKSAKMIFADFFIPHIQQFLYPPWKYLLH